MKHPGHRAAGANGIVHPGVRHAPGQCMTAFHADVVGMAVPGDHFRSFSGGKRIAHARKLTGDHSILML